MADLNTTLTETLESRMVTVCQRLIQVAEDERLKSWRFPYADRFLEGLINKLKAEQKEWEL